jgi:hypothetical protein
MFRKLGLIIIYYVTSEMSQSVSCLLRPISIYTGEKYDIHTRRISNNNNSYSLYRIIL